MPVRPMPLAAATNRLSRAEITAVYERGPEAVILLVEGLLDKIDGLESRVKRLEARLEVLENQRRKNSRNSSKPPSGDGFGKRTQSQRVKSERPSGGQVGHEGETLAWETEPDQVVWHEVSLCGGCGASLADVTASDWQARQVYELVPQLVDVIEHRAAVKVCAGCGQANCGAFPVGVNSPVQYGPGLKGLFVYLQDYQLLPSGRVQELLDDVLGIRPSEGTLYANRTTCAASLSGVNDQIKAAIQTASVAHFDETGFRVQGRLMWLLVASTAQLTQYFVHAKRGTAAIDAMAILPQFTGRAIHDGWRSYATYTDCAHGLCNAHHLRELQFITERYAQPWAEAMRRLLVRAKQAVADAIEAGQAALPFYQVQQLERDYQALIQQGFAANPPLPETANTPGPTKQSPPKNLLDRLHHQQSQVLVFIYDFRIPFDNNQAERDIRMMKLKQKISGGFRAFTGAQEFCAIRSYLSTCRKQGINLLDALQHTFLGNPIIPSLRPE
jgi:transposase